VKKEKEENHSNSVAPQTFQVKQFDPSPRAAVETNSGTMDVKAAVGV